MVFKTQTCVHVFFRLSFPKKHNTGAGTAKTMSSFWRKSIHDTRGRAVLPHFFPSSRAAERRSAGFGRVWPPRGEVGLGWVGFHGRSAGAPFGFHGRKGSFDAFSLSSERCGSKMGVAQDENARLAHLPLVFASIYQDAILGTYS